MTAYFLESQTSSSGWSKPGVMVLTLYVASDMHGWFIFIWASDFYLQVSTFGLGPVTHPVQLRVTNQFVKEFKLLDVQKSDFG